MELISKEEVLKIIKEAIIEDEYECGDGDWVSCIDFQYTDAVERINDLPMIFLGEELVCDTAIAWNKGYMAGIKERPKGKWIPLQDGTLTCSVCGKPRCEEWLSYCYECGAEMEIEEWN